MLTRGNREGVGRLLEVDAELALGVHTVTWSMESEHLLPLHSARGLGTVHLDTTLVLEFKRSCEAIAAWDAPLPLLHERVGSDACSGTRTTLNEHVVAERHSVLATW